MGLSGFQAYRSHHSITFRPSFEDKDQRAASLFQVFRTLNFKLCQFLPTTSQFTRRGRSTLVWSAAVDGLDTDASCK
jgi:hypothetical protein